MHLTLVPPLQEPKPRRQSAPTDAVTRAPDLGWVRRSLGWCDLLSRERSLTGSDQALVAFAIEWAPYGGADAESVFVKFGVQRTRFLHLLQAAMMPRPTEPRRFRGIKADLCRELLLAWQPAVRPTARPTA
ncbi:hypothetical protein [Rhodococcoides kyotonense]|uniref:DUF3263 domain-containing protein n=1 Tax=Rhodococcoides kyotonense TaxID=398843 RepID=A0A239LG44_9NOCA|nr:hypothetical protein [Rhodococcus kyotonensis]SNT29260.1 hypothetical protein SAMN05421642_11320 [Rhodococcus kyotonensis]